MRGGSADGGRVRTNLSALMRVDSAPNSVSSSYQQLPAPAECQLPMLPAAGGRGRVRADGGRREPPPQLKGGEGGGY